MDWEYQHLCGTLEQLGWHSRPDIVFGWNQFDTYEEYWAVQMAGCTCERQERETFKHQLFLCLLWLLNYGTKMTLIVSINVFYPFMCLDVVKRAWKALHPMSRGEQVKINLPQSRCNLGNQNVWPCDRPRAASRFFFNGPKWRSVTAASSQRRDTKPLHHFSCAHAPSPFSVICFATHQNSLTSSWILFKSILNSWIHNHTHHLINFHLISHPK